MAISSSTLPIFEETCAAWLRRLANDNTVEACEIRCDAQDLIDELRGWPVKPPDAVWRTETIAKVIALHRRALEHALRSKP